MSPTPLPGSGEGRRVLRIRVRAVGRVGELVGRERRVELGEGASVEELLNVLGAGLAEEAREGRLIVVVGGRGADPSTVLRDGDEVVLLPEMGGG